MAKQRTPRMSRTSGSPIARRRRENPVSIPGPEGSSLASTVFHREIAARAYELFLARGGQHGGDWADWLQAEAEVLGKMNRRGRPAGR